MAFAFQHLHIHLAQGTEGFLNLGKALHGTGIGGFGLLPVLGGFLCVLLGLFLGLLALGEEIKVRHLLLDLVNGQLIAIQLRLSFLICLHGGKGILDGGFLAFQVLFQLTLFPGGILKGLGGIRERLETGKHAVQGFACSFGNCLALGHGVLLAFQRR